MKVEWEITPQEVRARRKQTYKKIWWIFLIGFPLGMIGIISSMSEPLDSITEYAILFTIAIAGLIVVGFFIQLPFARHRKYVIDDEGIEITRGKRSKKFFWKDFKMYHEWTLISTMSAGSKNAVEIGQEISGKKYYIYLKGKKFGLFTEIIIVFVEPDVLEQAQNIFEEKISEFDKEEYDRIQKGLVHHYFD